jgi:DNA-binding CsgD family transcriptional regulator
MHPEIQPGPLPVLIEREEELKRLDALHEDVLVGRGRVVAVEGPAGIGKSSLVAAAAAAASAQGIRVLRARGSELERDIPFGVARQWFEPVLVAAGSEQRELLVDGAAGLARPVAWPATAPDTELTASPQILHGVFWLTFNLCAIGACLLALDDAQWADEASLRLLHYLAVRIDGISAGLIVACREADPDGEAGLLVRLLAEPATEVLRPAPLSRRATARLLAGESTREPDEQFVAASHTATGGNPFYVRELAQAAQEAGLGSTREDVATLRELRPRGLSRALLARASPAARSLAWALAVLDEPVDSVLASEVAGLAEDGARAAAEELAAAGLISGTVTLALAHPIVRGAVLASLSISRRSELHARAAQVLRKRGTEPQQLAAHLLAVTPAADITVVGVLQEAAQRSLAQGAPEVAARLLHRALREPPPGERRPQLLILLGRAEREAGLPAARERFREAWRLAVDPVAAAEALRWLAWTIGNDAGEQAKLAVDLDQAIVAVLPLDRECALALEEARLAGLMLTPARRAEFGARLERIGVLPGTTPEECAVLAMRARYLMDTGASAAAVGEAAEAAVRHPAAVEVKGPDSLWALNCAVALLGAERFDVLESFLTRALSVVRTRGSAPGFALISTHLGRLANRLGDPRHAEAETRAALESGGLSGFYRFATSSVLMRSLIEQGRIEEAQEVYTATGLGEQMPDPRPMTPLLIVRGELRRAQGELDRAVADLRESVARIRRYTDRTSAGLDGRLLLAETLHELGRTDDAIQEAREALTIARAWGAPGALGDAERLYGLLLGGERGIDHLRQATERLAQTPARLSHARALIDLGAALRRAGRRGECREHLREGLERAEQSSANPLAARAREELAATGIRVPRRRIGDPLTPSERRIVELAAAGESNPRIAQALFVTVKTVESHLANAYRKLGVSSRRELPAALAEQRLD